MNLLTSTILATIDFSISEFFMSFLQVFFTSATNALYIVFGWTLILFSSAEKSQEYANTLGSFLFTCVFCCPPVANIFTYFFAGLISFPSLFDKSSFLSFNRSLTITKFFIFLTLPATCSGIYYIVIHNDQNHIIVPAKLFCGTVNPTIANCAGSLTAKLITYLSILPVINPWKLVTYVVYIIEFFAGLLSKS